ncbi:DNA-processing protein DprA [Chitinilyticum litopenaei]|uniref:DNA-processing protein DprA n=1 Tax=Chitinilyticum litopenaei TaxID=1121276 RepID=UPI0004297407|nr:DNA-processing protein DprA [Chitinilyticum litopenaei]
MSEHDAWLRLALAPGLTTRRRLRLLQLAGGAPQIHPLADKLLPELVRPDALAQARAFFDPDHEQPDVAAALRWLEDPGHSLLTLGEPAYPRALLDLPDPPVLLFAKGNPETLLHFGLAIVGSRNPTPQGVNHAHDFAAELAGRGAVIISGLAAGIDAAAHAGALQAGGLTVAIVGTGLDRVYPAANRDLAHRVAETGLLLSELPLGAPPKAEHFPMRNRLIAALGQGCLVVEATEGSGSLITAKQAADLGREVFAIPGSIHSPLAKGCHWLIKQGAKLVDSVNDISDELAWPVRPQAVIGPAGKVQSGTPVPNEDAQDAVLLQQLGWDPVDLDTLALRSGLTHGRLCEILLGLELQGAVLVLPGGRYQRVANDRVM